VGGERWRWRWRWRRERKRKREKRRKGGEGKRRGFLKEGSRVMSDISSFTGGK
jgi:hypothetical protein